jgi:uncharacterized lipoprotein YajG
MREALLPTSPNHEDKMTRVQLLMIAAMGVVFAGCSDQSDNQQNQTVSPEPNAQMDTRKSPQTSTGGESQTTTPSGNENKPTPPAN